MSLPEFPLESLSGQDAAQLAKIRKEMTEGFTSMASFGKCVSIFGSSRAARESADYHATEKIAYLLGKAGYGIITGGGPGLMEAANKGATDAGAASIGLHIHLPHEQRVNEYVTTRSNYHYFLVRKLMFVKYAIAYVIMPGGMGTLDELTEAFVLVQTARIKPFPVILYDSSYWNGMLDWLRNNMLARGYIDEKELDLFVVKDTPESVAEHISKHVIL